MEIMGKETDKIEKAVIYARYSSDRQTEQSIEGQLRECELYAEKNGYQVIAKYIDRALTGKVDARPDFQRLIKDSDKHLFDFVIVYQLDRFSRNRYDSAHYKHILKKNGVKVLSAKENISNDPSGILMETMLEGMAEYYSAELAQKVTRGLRESFLKGQATGRASYGYRTNPEKKFVIDTNEANTVRMIFQMYADGKTITEIQNEFTIKDIVNAKGKPFHKQSMIEILSNKRYIGTLTFGKEENPNSIPAIIDQNIFDIVQARLLKNKRSHSDYKAQERYLLSGKLFCGYCKNHIIADSVHKKNDTIYRYYKCYLIKNNKGKCEKQVAHKKWLEDLVINTTLRVLKQDGIIDKITAQVIEYDKTRQANENLPYLEKQLKDTESKINGIITALENGIFSDSTKQRLLELESIKADLIYKIDEEKLNIPIPLEYNQVKFWFMKFTQGQADDEIFRERIIDTFINKVILWNDKIIITFNIKGKDGNTITVDDIIKDFDTQSPNITKFDLELFGGGEEIRTHDPLLAGQVL